MKADSPEMHPDYWDAVSNVMCCKLALQLQCYDEVTVAVSVMLTFVKICYNGRSKLTRA